MEMALLSGKTNGSPAGKAIFAVLSGVIGTLVLAAFCVGIMDIYSVVKYLPWIVGFNTAMTGFSLIEKTKNRIRRKHLAAVGAGIANVIIALGALMLLSNYFAGENLIGVSSALLIVVIGAICSAAGAWLAIKAQQVKKT